MTDIRQIMTTAPVIPVLVIEDIAHAVPLAEALVEGGLPCLEVTLRTDCALDAIRAMKQVEGAIVGAGTVLSQADLAKVESAGAEFVVSPGLTEDLGRAALRSGLPFLPGTATGSDIMRGLDMGLTHFKFFPAEANGGLPALKAIGGPFGNVFFCPTGGISLENASSWLAHPQVLCVGGSWVAPKGAPDQERIRTLASEAAGLRA
jgi:2-dehydro-3-deoxyphosphogluconate aldolase/(4S)-4-hydroxy-2-oxoglutarate aldolase